MLRSPSNPRPLAPLPEHLAHRGRSPRTPAPGRAWRSGAPLWSLPTSRRPTGSPRRRPSGSPTSGGQRGRQRPRGAVTRCLRPRSGAPAPPRPAAGGLFAFPQGSLAPQARAGSDPASVGKTAGISPDCGAVDPSIGGGSLPAPLSAPKAGSGFAGTPPKRNGANGFREARRGEAMSKTPGKRGGCLWPTRKRPRGRPRPGQVTHPRRAGLALRPGTPGRPLILADGAPLPARSTRRDRRERPARPPGGGGRPDGGGPGRRSKVPSVPFAAPPAAARGPGLRPPVRSKVAGVPAVTLPNSGLPAVADVSPGVIPAFGDCVQLQDETGSYARARRGAEHRACRSGGRYRENRPAFQAGASPGLVSSALRRNHSSTWGLRRAQCGAPRVPVWRPAFQAGCAARLGGVGTCAARSAARGAARAGPRR